MKTAVSRGASRLTASVSHYNVNYQTWRAVLGTLAVLCLVACGETPPAAAPKSGSAPAASLTAAGAPELTAEQLQAAEKFYRRKTVSIIVGSGAGGGFDIFTVHVDGTDEHQVTASTGNNEDPSWSPDGRYLVFSSTRRGVPGLYVADATGASQVPLTDRAGGDTSPAWSNWLE